MDSTGNLYDYPRASIEQRKQMRQLRRLGSTSGDLLTDVSVDDLIQKLTSERLAGRGDSAADCGSHSTQA